MNAWFESLLPRERMFVMAAAVAIIFAVFWFALWQPLARSEADLGARIENWQTSLQELRPLRGRLLAPGSQSSAGAAQNQSLVVIVDNTLRSRNLYTSLQRSQPTNNNGIRVEFDNVSFDDLVLWLGDLDNRYGLNVQTASFSQSTSNNPGRINASLTLERA